MDTYVQAVTDEKLKASLSSQGTLGVVMNPLTFAQSDPNVFQVAAWQAVVFGTIFAAITGVIQLGLGIWRQRKEDKRKRAEIGYGLLDAMFDDELSGQMLYVLDSINLVSYKGSTDRFNPEEFKRALTAGEKASARDEEIQRRLDALLYYFDRFEHAIQAGLTDFDTLKMPPGYYVKLLQEYKPELVAYFDTIGYERVRQFLNRYPEWSDASNSHKR